ncbi:MAG: FHA domain-containing protein [Acidobacteriota bacterium]
MRVRFTHLTGSLRGTVEELSLPIVRVGRALSSDLLLQDDTGLHRLASRMHAEFRLEGEEFVIYDLKSRNGTFVNGKAIERQVLFDGDQVSFGLNGMSFQVNFIVTPDEEIEFLRNTPLFKDLSDDLLQRIYQRGQLESYEAGSILFRSGEPSNNLYVLRNGIIELRSPQQGNPKPLINYLGPGQTLGETTALLGEAHISEAGIPEGAEIFSLSTERLRELIRTNPELAEHFVLTFARYLSHSYQRLSLQTKSKLQGSLFYFDLATVIQTLITSKESGLLTIYSVGQSLVRSMAWSNSLGAYPVGQVYLEEGEVRYAWAGTLTGIEAFYQLFQAELNGSFSFEQNAKMDEHSWGEMIDCPSMSLVLEAARLQDELNRLRQRFPESKAVLHLNVTALKLPEKSYLPILDNLYQLLAERTMTLIELLDNLPCCYYVTYYLLNELVETGQITVSV